MNNTDARNMGHGHVTPRPDGYRSRCGGPAICVVCQAERAAFEAATQPPQDERGHGLSEEYTYALNLAMAIYRDEYADKAPDWKPLPDLLGLLTQIDNMVAGLRKPHLAAQPVALSTLTDAQILAGVKEFADENYYANYKDDILRCVRTLLAASAPAQQGEPQQPEPVAWLESEPSTTDWPLRNLFFGLSAVAYSSRMHFGEKPAKLLGSGNRLTALYATTPQPVAAEVTTEEDQMAFNKHIMEEGLNTSMHPLHYLFLNPTTNAARQAWKAAIRFMQDRAMAGTGSDESGENGNG